MFGQRAGDTGMAEHAFCTKTLHFQCQPVRRWPILFMTGFASGRGMQRTSSHRDVRARHRMTVGAQQPSIPFGAALHRAVLPFGVPEPCGRTRLTIAACKRAALRRGPSLAKLAARARCFVLLRLHGPAAGPVRARGRNDGHGRPA